MPEEKVVIECVTSHKRVVKATPTGARRAGWRKLQECGAKPPPECETGRTWIGWCPSCVEEFSVEEER